MTSNAVIGFPRWTEKVTLSGGSWNASYPLSNLKVQAQGHRERIEEITANADIAESAALYKTYSTGIEWVDALNGTVRPVLAYAFFLVFALNKAYLAYSFVPNPALPWITLAQVLWTPEDSVIFASIISFYFGSRALSRARQGK